MDELRIAAFSYNDKGGNPAGVVICSEMPTEKEMLETAKQIGYSETSFLKQVEDGWRVRYFAPEMEVQFCGHATIASGAVLGERRPLQTPHQPGRHKRQRFKIGDGRIYGNIAISGNMV